MSDAAALGIELAVARHVYKRTSERGTIIVVTSARAGRAGLGGAVVRY